MSSASGSRLLRLLREKWWMFVLNSSTGFASEAEELRHAAFRLFRLSLSARPAGVAASCARRSAASQYSPLFASSVPSSRYFFAICSKCSEISIARLSILLTPAYCFEVSRFTRSVSPSSSRNSCRPASSLALSAC